jgi:hypothetical protein
MYRYVKTVTVLFCSFLASSTLARAVNKIKCYIYLARLPTGTYYIEKPQQKQNDDFFKTELQVGTYPIVL